MMLDPDAIADRRRLKRKLGVWRILAFVAAVVALVAIAARFEAIDGIGAKSLPHVARITVKGMMLPDRALIEMIDKIAKADAVKGVVVDIDSPGGASSAGEALHGALRRLAEKKPTAAFVGSLAASAGYMAAIGTDHVVIRRSALTGSIGVLVQWGDVTDLMKTVGVKLEEVKSSPMKAEPTPFKPTSPEARAMLDRVVKDTYDWFVGLVAERRGLTPAAARELADGRVVTGAQAVKLKLADEIGEERTAIEWLQSKGVAADLPIRDWKPKAGADAWPTVSALAEATTRGIAAALGLEGVIARTGSLDVPQSVWHLGREENPSVSGEIGR
ncbi:MAG: signal peptide peptidase SppA [Siculibacillus sp.]